MVEPCSAHFKELYDEQSSTRFMRLPPTYKITANDLKERVTVADPPLSPQHSPSAPTVSSQSISDPSSTITQSKHNAPTSFPPSQQSHSQPLATSTQGVLHSPVSTTRNTSQELSLQNGMERWKCCRTHSRFCGLRSKSYVMKNSDTTCSRCKHSRCTGCELA